MLAKAGDVVRILDILQINQDIPEAAQHAGVRNCRGAICVSSVQRGNPVDVVPRKRYTSRSMGPPSKGAP